MYDTILPDVQEILEGTERAGRVQYTSQGVDKVLTLAKWSGRKKFLVAKVQ